MTLSMALIGAQGETEKILSQLLFGKGKEPSLPGMKALIKKLNVKFPFP